MSAQAGNQAKSSGCAGCALLQGVYDRIAQYHVATVFEDVELHFGLAMK